MVGLGAGVVGFGRGEGGAGVVDGQAIVGGIELGDQVARLDRRADIDGAGDDLAGDAEAEIGLDARHDGAGQHQGLAAPLIGDLDDARRADDGLVGGGGAGGVGRPGKGREAGGGRCSGTQDDGHSFEGNLAEELGVRNTHG
jgi:hypothetical protein